LIPEGVFAPLWVTEFPMFEFNEADGRYYAMHHPFTSPLDDDLPLMERAVEGGETHLLGSLRAKAYDAVINGVEVAGGSIRIHRRDVQRLIFRALGMDEETARQRFGFFLEALEYGTPPHGGIASGIERLLMVLVPTDNIRDVMAFPKTASAADLMIEAPGEIDQHQLNELGIRIMKHIPHDEFNAEVFRRVCQKALETLLPTAHQEQSDLETRQELALEHLLNEVRAFCGVREPLKLEDVTGYPRSVLLVQEIGGTVEMDSLHYHQTSVFFNKVPIIDEYVEQATGKKVTEYVRETLNRAQ
jgi:hypothetical protein